MTFRRSLIVLTLGLGLALGAGLLTLTGSAAPGNPVFDPPPNSHAAPLTTTVSIVYDELIDPTTVTSHTFAVHGMQSGLVTATHTVHGSTIVVTPARSFHQGELVYVVATTRTLSVTGTEPVSSTQWQFNAGRVFSRCVGGFIRVDAGLTGGDDSSAAWGDYDTDGDLDILLTEDAGWRVYRNDGPVAGRGWSFTEIQPQPPFVQNDSAVWGDYDGDGDLDILFTGDYNASWVYRNENGGFVAIDAGLPGVRDSSAAWGDYDNDGDLDILLAGNDDSYVPVSKVYRNDDGDFVDVDAGLTGIAYGSVAWGDYDNDGDLDVLLTGSSTSGYVLRIYRNDGPSTGPGWIFTDIDAGMTGVRYGSAAWGDYDNDGDLDILLAGEESTFNHVSRVYRNDGETFTEIDPGLAGVRNGSVAWGDYDNDGDLDILLTGETSSYGGVSRVYRNDGGTFTDIGLGLTGVRSGSAAWGDYDGDDDLDILLTGSGSGGDVSQLYRNDDCVADLSIIKFVTPRYVEPGDPVTYTLAFLNNGPLTATGVVITDIVPVSATVNTIISSGVSITDTGASPSYVWRTQDLVRGAGGIVTITARVSDALSGGYVLPNIASVNATTVDVYTDDNRSAGRAIVSPLRIISTFPDAQALGVPLTTTVSATVDDDVDAGTITASTFAVHGMMSGLVTGTFGYDGPERTLTLTAGRPFHAGEVVRASATEGIQDVTGTPLAAYQWQFTAGSAGPRCFWDFTDIGAGLAGVERSSAAWGDYDGDGDLDILLTGDDGDSLISRVYRNDGGGFTDIDAGLPGIWRGSAAWGDYDNDGDLDILLAGDIDGGELSRVYRNDDGHFVDVNAGLMGVWSSAVAWGDYDNDGDLDILLTGRDSGSDRVSLVYRNDGGSFVDIDAGLAGVHIGSVAWGDYDNDGDLDVLLTGQGNDSGRMSEVYRNDGPAAGGGWTFTRIDAGLTPVHSGSAAWGDYDNDGDLDILLMGDADNGVVQVYRNDGGSFVDIDAGLEGAFDGGAAWGDYDNDGDLDILLAGYYSGFPSGRYLAQVYRNDGGTFVDIDAGLPGVRYGSVAWGDYDGDGDLDVLLTGQDSSGTPGAWIYRNNDCAPDLEIAKSTMPPLGADPGEPITYTLAFFNHGVLTATQVVITDVVPVSVTVTGVTSGGVVITDTGTVPAYVWRVQDLAPDQGGAITLTAQISTTLSDGDAFTNTATITSVVEDVDTTNNASSVRTVVSPLYVAATAPAAQALGVPPTTTVAAVLSTDVDMTTVSTATFAVHGMMSGLVTGTFGYDGPDRTLTLTPGRPFCAGEAVRASATSGIGTPGGGSLFPYQWQFTAGIVNPRCVGGFTDVGTGLADIVDSSAAWGDYDNDGDLDILLTGQIEYETGASRVYRNDGGSFTDINAGLNAVRNGSAAWGDYDNDGDLDILLTGIDDDNARVSQLYRNDGGSFTDVGAGLVGVNSSSVAWGDYDNDGDLDILLTGASSSGRASLVYRNDSGTFTDVNAGLTAVFRASVAWGDYDNDGDLDILLAGFTSVGSPVSQVYRNDAGTFIDVGAGLTGIAYGSAAWGDYDGDGDLDILLMGEDADWDLVSHLYRNDDGTFAEVDAGIPGAGYCSVAWGDYDNDGDLDVLLAGSGASGSGIADVYRNDGLAPGLGWTFTSIDAGLAGVNEASAAWGDYDGDGDLDALLTGYGSQGYMTRLYRNDDCGADMAIAKSVTPRVAEPGQTITYTLAFSNVGTLTATQVLITDAVPVSVTVTGVVSSGVALTDTDSIPFYVWRAQDLAPGEGGFITITGQLSTTLLDGHVFTNTAVVATTELDIESGNDQSAVQVVATLKMRVIATAPAAQALGVPLTTTVSASFDDDVNGSTVGTTTFAVHGMMGGLVTGTFRYDGPNRTLTLAPSRPFHAGEVVRTSATAGIQSLAGAFLVPYQWQFTAGRVYSRCVGGFTDVGAGLAGVSEGSAAWGDYDNDGDLDILLAGSGVSRVYRNDGGAFTDVGAGLAGVSEGSAAWGDYDNDGDLDILLTGWTGSDSVSLVYRNDGGSFVDVNAGLVGVQSGSAAWGDYDNDGDLDILLAGCDDWFVIGCNSRTSLVYRNDGHGAFADVAAGLTGVNAAAVAWGDYDNDGDLDIVLKGYDGGSGVSQVYRNDGPMASSGWAFTNIGAGLAGVYGGSVAWGDYDNDSDLDILLTGEDAFNTSRVYRNDDGVFVVTSAGLAFDADRSIWGDYDNDGDLDILAVGRIGTTEVAWVYRNDGGVFTGVEVELAGVSGGSVAWGDYDDDGDLDVLLAGEDGSGPVSRIYRNDDCVPASQVDVSIAKSVSPHIAEPGQALTYTLTFANQGTLTATQVVITDVVPVGVAVTGISSSVAITGNAIVPVYAWQVQDLAPGAGGIITVTGVLSYPLASGVYTNTVDIVAQEVDSDTVNNSSGAGVVVPNVAPVAVAGSHQIVETDTVVTLDGSGSSDANGDTLSYLWTQTGGQAVALSGRDVASTTFTAPASISVLTFTLTVSDTGGLSDTDTVVIAVVEDGTPVLEVAKSVDTGGLTEVPLGGVVTYTVMIRNDGGGVARSVTMTDPLPAGVSFGVWVEQGGGTVNLPLQTVAWGPADVVAGGAYTVAFTAQVTESASFAGAMIANFAYAVAANAVPIDDGASFAVESTCRIYLPLVVRND